MRTTMEKKIEVKNDERLELIQQLIIKFTLFDFSGRIPVSEKGDDMDAIIVGLNTLGEELESKSSLLDQEKKRINDIQDVLLKYTIMDFSEKISVSEKGDELDAIVVGLNTLSEELVSHITQLKENEERIQASQKIFSTVFYKSPVMNSITDANTGKFIDVNENFVEFSGFTKEEIIGRSSLELNLIPNPEQRAEVISAIKKNGYTRDVIMELRSKKGETRWVSTSSHAVNIDDTDCFLTAMIDITERKKAEEQLEMVNKELEAFSYSVSHDLRAPLRAISGYANIISEDYRKVLDGEGKRLLEVVQYNAKKMGTLIDDLLAFSRLGRKEIQKTTIEMKELIEGALIELGKTVEHKAEVRIGEIHPAQADYSLINHVFVNLISNAVKYSSKTEKPVVEIKSEKKNGEVIYSVSDNGAGFDMQYAHKLFGVFQRLHTMEEFEGTGVGLAIVQRVVSKHGGKVWADAKINKGATFYFSLPIN